MVSSHPVFPPLTGSDRLVSRAKDPYEDIRHAYLVEIKIPESPKTVASPTLLPDSTPTTRHAEDSVDSNTSGVRHTSSNFTVPLSPDHPLTHASPTLVPFIHRTARMAVRVPPAMSPGLSASIAEVATVSDSAFCKRFRSSYESSPSSSPPNLTSRKHYWGRYELVEDGEEEDGEEEDDKEEDKEIEESSDFDSKSKDAEDEGPTAEDEDSAAGDEGLAAGDEGSDMRVESLGLEGDATVPEGQQRAAPIVETVVGEPLRLGYRALRRRKITLGEGRMPSVFETPPSPEWSSGSLPIPSPILSPVIPLTVPSPIASLATAEAEGFLTELGARVEMHGGLIHDHMVRLGELSPALSLEHEQERVAVTFGAIWRPVLALESWAEERHARLDLAEIVDSMKRGQEPRGDV
ncbi:hypothetical protein Tco_1174950 [Tanacetum coccineum]